MPIIDLTKPRYDQNTYQGRLLHFIKLTNPSNLFVTDEQLLQYQDLLDRYAAAIKGSSAIDPSFDEEELWTAKTVIDATLHPDTREKIPLPFRMSAFVPTNLIVTAGLLIPNPALTTMLFWQWANQSVNVAFNWCNANKTSPMSVTETMTAYTGAVSTSIALSFGLSRLARGMKESPGSRLFKAMVPFMTVAVANIVNVFMMRGKELSDGIQVFDADGRVAEEGKSRIAAQTALTQVAISRIVIAFPCLSLPPLVMGRLMLRPRFASSPALQFATNLGLITTSLLTALPCAIALFPQTGSLPRSSLEPKFQSQPSLLLDKPLFFNKGL